MLRALRVEEQRAVQLALSGASTLLNAAPRARDALVFAAAASIARHPVLVASPLAAELVEHAAHLPGIDVAAFGSFVSPATAAASKRRVEQGGALLVVVEPRFLFDATLRETFAKAQISLLGIAAAHACSEHAHELSPAYISLREAVRALGAPVLATCTQTSDRVVDQVLGAIGAPASSIIDHAEPELTRAAQVVRATERKTALLAAITGYGSPGIVLTATPQEADSVFADLSARKIACLRAHSGMSPSERAEALSRFAAPNERAVLVTQSPHANASGLAGYPEATLGLGSAPPRSDLRFVVHYQAPLSPEQLFEDLAWLPAGAFSLVLADSSDAALVQALLAQQRIKPAAVEAMAQALAQAPPERPAYADTLALRAGTSRRSAERVLGAFVDRNLIARDSGQISRQASAEQLGQDARLISARFASLRAADAARAEQIAHYVTSRHEKLLVADAAPIEASRRVMG
ncbi:MAG TPA: hypothetical protein VEQ58_10530 [Polyangiaceae bacterium]|nr:hypothetical protein [Polyangiaceae bacterium]